MKLNGLNLLFFLFLVMGCNKKSMTYDNSKMSPYTLQLVEYLSSMNGNPEPKAISRFGLKEDDAGFYVKGLIQVNESIDDAELDRLGVTQNTKAGQVRTVRIPIDQLAALSSMAEINYIEIDKPLDLK